MGCFIPIESRLKYMGFGLIAGIDEACRGPLAGPVVSAFVILKDDFFSKDLDDSKVLSEKKRKKLFKQILKNCIDYAIAIVPHSTIDKINILNAVRTANFLCLSELKCKPDIVLIDGIDKQIIDMPFVTIIKGDSRVKSIAAASILAKVVRDKIMKHYHKDYPCYGFNRHMGYGTREHRGAIGKYGPCEIHRRSYTVKKI